MPYLPDHNCLFVHIPKNAGRSIEAALLGGNGSPDGGRRTLVNRTATLLARSTAPRFAKKHLIGSLDVTLAAQHLTFVEMEMLGLLPEKNNYVTFCVVRNPYDRALSSVMHFSRTEWKDCSDEEMRQIGFEQDLKAWLNSPITDHNLRAHRRSQLDFVRDRRGKIAVDHILRFETLAEDFSRLSVELGWNRTKLGNIGWGRRPRKYSEYYSAESKKCIQDHFSEDFDAFGYSI